MSFKDRFKNRNEVVGRDGANSFTGPRSTVGGGSNAPSQKSAPYQPVPQQQQQPMSGGYSPAPSVYSNQAPAYQSQAPSFFMTGGGYPVVPPIAFNPYGATSVQPLPPINGGYQQQQQQQQPPDAFNQQLHQSPSQAQLLGGQRRTLAQTMVSPYDGEESPGSNGRRTRRKPGLPDFHELAVLSHDRRIGQQSVERMPVLIDHPHAGEYHEYNLREYKRLQRQYARQKWGGLGPEDNEEKRAEREKRKKILDYAKQVNAVNFAVMDVNLGEEWHNRPIEKKPTFEAQLGQIKRQRAMQYAEAVKPKVVSARGKAATPQPTSNTNIDKELEGLEEKHRRDQEAIMRIKAQLNMLT